jgi:hypothetical protein
MPVLGLNILADRGLSEDQLAADAQALGARYHLVMGSPRLAQRLLDSGSRVIYRHFPDDDNVQDRTEPRARVRLLHQLAPKGCSLYLGNEPSRAVIPQLNTWTVTALDECEKLGRKGVILNFATGNPEPGDWEGLRPCVERAFNGGHILGLHQYFDKTIAVSAPWHVGRDRDARAVFGDKTPEIVITELGVAVGYDPYKGWRVALTSEAFATELRQAAEIYYLPHGIHACIFAVCPDNDSQWGTFNPSRRVLELSAAINRTAQPREPVVTNPPAPVPKPANPGPPSSGELQTSTYVRVRNAPSVRASEVGQLKQNQLVVWYPATQQTADTYDWVFIEAKQTDGTTVSGWMARVWAQWTLQFKSPVVPAPEPMPVSPEPEPVPTPPAPAPVTPAILAEAGAIRDALAQLEQDSARLEEQTRQLRARLDQLVQKLGGG